MSKEEEVSRFVAFCIEQYKHRHGGDGERTFALFDETGVIRFLTEFFDVEHCLDSEQIVDDIEQIIRRKAHVACAVLGESGGLMQGEVTQQNLHLFIPGKIARVAALLAQATGRSVLDCMREFYATPTCKCLEREDTKYWHYSPAQLLALTCPAQK